MSTPSEQLAQAREALHRLLTGEAAVSFTDSNGEKLEYKPADAKRLAAYVETLAGEVAGQSRPHTIRFQSSKGL